MSYKECLLIDGRNWCFRNGFTRQNLSSAGRPTGAIFGCLASLIRLARIFPHARFVFVWDGEYTRESWRNKLAANYKGNRVTKKGEKVPPHIQAIRTQIPIITKFVADFGFKSYSVPRLEADDLIGILATSLKKKYDKVIVYSMDKDFIQLIKGNVQLVRDLDKSSTCKPTSLAEIKKKFDVLPKNWLHYRSLVGESTDNIDKPIAGVGPKKAIAMLKAGVDPSVSEPHPDYIAHWPKIRLCYRLTKIIRKPHDKRLPEISKGQIRIILKEVASSNLLRPKSSKTKKSYNRMMKFLIEYELSEIIERRHQLWKIK